MTLPNRTRLAKRKLEIQEVRKEKQTETSKKHDKRCHETSNAKTDDVAEQLKSLQEKYEQLVIEHGQNVLLIKELRDEIAVFVAKDKVSAETQTESEFQDYHCKDCIYVASCMEELDWHAGDAHEMHMIILSKGV